MSVVDKIKAQAKELIDNGNSHEICTGRGMETVVDELGNYVEGFNILMDYFDILPEDQKDEVGQQLTNLGL